MGRAKKERAKADTDSLNYVKREIRQYWKLKEQCSSFEKTRPHLLQAANIDPDIFCPECYPSREMLLFSEVPEADRQSVELYLSAKETVYLIEHGIWQLEAGVKAVMEDLYYRGMPWEEVMQKHNISRMTLCRTKNRGLNEIAVYAGSYFQWKVEQLYM